MDKFNLKEYLKHNRLLKESEKYCTFCTCVVINSFSMETSSHLFKDVGYGSFNLKITVTSSLTVVKSNT